MDELEKIDKWLCNKLADIAKKLPNLAHSEPASFACGFNIGYKQAMLDLNRYLDMLRPTSDI